MKLCEPIKQKVETVVKFTDNFLEIIPEPNAIEVDSFDLQKLLEERRVMIQMIEVYKLDDMKEELEEINKKIEKYRPEDIYKFRMPVFLKDISDYEFGYFDMDGMMIKLHVKEQRIELAVPLKVSDKSSDQTEYFKNFYDDIIEKCKSKYINTIKPKKKETIDLSGIIKGENWFKVLYPDGRIRFTRHSTIDNLKELYKRLKIYIKSIEPYREELINA